MRGGGLIVVGLLAAVLTASGSGSPVRVHAAAWPDPRVAAPVSADADGDGVFDALDARLARMPVAGKVDVLVALSAPASGARVDELSRRAGGFSTIRRFGVVDAFAATLTSAQVSALARMPGVDHVELDSVMHVMNDSAQSSFGVTKARLDAPGLDGDADGNPSAYSPGDMVAAVLDTGIDTGHADLDQGKVIGFKDFINGRTAPYDDEGHGTHVAATLAGDGDARSDHRYQGVAPRAALVGVKVIAADGFGTADSTLAGIDWVVANKDVYGIEAMNLSLGADGCSDGTDVVSQAVERAVAAGLVVSVAAGNEGPGACTIGSPAAAASALTVGAMSDLGAGGFALAYFSSRGPTADGRVKPDVVGPGVDITSAAAGTVTGYEAADGTSSATPFVTGVALLMREANPSLTPAQVKSAIKSTAVDWGLTGPDSESGAGRLDAYAALEAAGAPLTTGPAVPVHHAQSGALAATGASAEYTFDVVDTTFPLAATLTMSSVAVANSSNPDFDLYLISPAQQQLVASSSFRRQETLTYPVAQTGAYTLRVVSRTGGGSFFLDVSGGIAPPGAPPQPGAPTLAGPTVGNNFVTLTWAPPSNVGAVNGYRIYRGTSSGGETVLATIGEATTFTDITATNGTTYWYQVSALSPSGESPRSNERAAKPAGALFHPYEETPVGSLPEAVAIGDVTGDGRNDVVMTTSFYFDEPNDYHLFVFAGLAGGGLAAPVSYLTAGTYNQRPKSVAVGDLTGDGRADVVVGLAGLGVQVFPQLPSGALGAPTMTSTPDSLKIRLGRLDGDSKLDVAGVGWGTDTVSVLLSDGNGGFRPPVTYAAPHAGYDDLEVADVSGDGRDDLVVMSGQTYGVPNLSVLPQLPSGGFGQAASYVLGSKILSHGVGVGDVTGDGRKDVVVSYGGNQPSSYIAVFAQNAAGTLAAPVSYPSADIPEPVDVADMNLDGLADVVVLHGGWDTAGLYRQQPGGTLGAEEPYALPYASHYDPHGLAIGDVTGDGAPDVVIADYNQGLVVLRNSTSIQAPGATVPGAPVLTSAKPGDRKVTLAWSAAAPNGASVLGYRIYRGTASGAETLLTTVGSVKGFVDTTAANGTTYHYEVSAVNAVGEGARSAERAATPAPPVVPDAPDLTSVAAGLQSVALAWSAPSSDGGAPITGYRIYRGTASGTEGLLTTTSSTSYVDSAATGGVTYWYQVSAVNSAGEGPRSNELSATPRLPTFAAYQATSVGSWPEAVAIGDVTGDGRNDVVMTTSFYFDDANDYHLFVFAGLADGTLAAPVSYLTAGTYGERPESVAIGDLTGDGRADVVVGLEGLGVQLFPQLPSGSLGAPTMTPTPDSLKIRLGRLDGDSTLDVAGVGWGTNTVSVLLNDGSGGLRTPVQYSVPHAGYDDLEVADVSGDGRDDLVVMSGQAYAVPNLSVLAQLPGGGFGQAASYRIGSNVNSHGVGVGDVTGDGKNDVVLSYGGNRPSSNIAVFAQNAAGTLAAPVSYPSYDIPEPLDVADIDLDGLADVVTLHGGWNSAGLYRQQPDGTLGAEEGYSIPYASHYDPHGLAVGDVTGDGIPDVVLADYNHGLVVLRNQTALRTLAAPPGAPALTAATAGVNEVSLTWTAPTSTGGSPLTGFRVYRGTAGGTKTLIATITNGNVRGYTGTGLVTGTSYEFEVSALNAAGEGAHSNALSATPVPPTVPGVPDLYSVTGGNGSVTVAWDNGLNGGSPITSYRIYRGLTGGGTKTLLATVGSVYEYLDANVANGTTYYYEVSAVSAVGEGPRSAERSGLPVGAPGAPALGTAAPGNGSVALAWSQPSANGGSPVTGYRVYRGTPGGAKAPLANLGVVASYTDSTAANGTEYAYEVSAVSALGESAHSNALAATPRTVPDAPRPVAATAGSHSVTLTWGVPSSNGGSPITGYRIQRFGSQDDVPLVVTVAPATTYTDTGLVNGLVHHYVVTALNAAGESDVATVVTVTPVGPANAPLLSDASAGDAAVTLSWRRPVASDDSPPDGGSPITGYAIYRGVGSGPKILLARVVAGGATVTFEYIDETPGNGTTYEYEVAAVNAIGESAHSNALAATPARVEATHTGRAPDEPPAATAPRESPPEIATLAVAQRPPLPHQG